jgi:glycosyltransferase involved in cell wall biosynthesis
MEKISVVITTYNRREVLEGLLDCLENQTDQDFETIVVMDNCTDDTEEMLKGRNLKYFDTKIEGYGLATARNIGIKNASGEIVVILDDDSYPTTDFVKEHKRTARRGTIVTGARLPDTDDDIDNLNAKMADLEERYSRPKRLKSFIVENNTCMYKTNWLQVPFDESIQHYGGIGQKFNKDLRENGYTCLFNPRAEIVHMSIYKRNYDLHSNNGGEE